MGCANLEGVVRVLCEFCTSFAQVEGVVRISHKPGAVVFRRPYLPHFNSKSLLCHILEHMGYPTKPHLERRHHCRNHFTLDQWTQLAERNSVESTPEAALPRPVPLVPAQPDQTQ
ncbi:hypothetical protein CK203_115159 [Vitis vinifera]|uniref:Uncharacterized protein n=1 Tax=Vitis vinifera TaxID=29760 RepID=A0A438FCV0_VITVI|nr:hypothetical protein CK203_115159 [Vitis vinifera]